MMTNEFFIAVWQTLLMIIIAGGIATFIGIPAGILLFISRPGNISPRPLLYKILSLLINALRSIPFIILLVAIIPFTRWIVGTSIGTAAAIVPLALCAFPFVARVVENALAEVPIGLIETAHAMGATRFQIIWKILLPEARSAIIRSITLMLITLVGYSAMAGAVGGGGLGNLAINYGYDRFQPGVMLITVCALIILVQLLQWLGDSLVKISTK